MTPQQQKVADDTARAVAKVRNEIIAKAAPIPDEVFNAWGFTKPYFAHNIAETAVHTAIAGSVAQADIQQAEIQKKLTPQVVRLLMPTIGTMLALSLVGAVAGAAVVVKMRG